MKNVVINVINSKFNSEINNVEQAFFFFTGICYESCIPIEENIDFFANFRLFIVDNYYNNFIHFDWHHIIRYHSNDDSESLSILNKLLYEYLETIN
jgi:hypothetical protein